jgi:hypothetical protein
MKKINFFGLLLSILVVMSCSSDDSSNDDNITENPDQMVNLLCEGNGSNSYFPLAIGNYWKWEYPFSFPSTPDITAEVIGTFDYNGITYYELEYTGSDGQYHFKYLREDSQGNLKVLVYFLSVNGNYYEEHTIIPNSSSFSAGDQWNFYAALDEFDSIEPVQRVQSVGTYDTETCSYEQALEIFTRNLQADTTIPQSAILDYKIYKKGVGIVNFDGNVLTEVILN